MTSIEFVSEVDQRALNYLTMILFGPAGVGKTTAAWSAPQPVLVITTEPDRRTRFARHLRVDKEGRDIREMLARSRNDLTQAYLYAREQSNGVQSVVIDTVAAAYRLALIHEMGTDRTKPSLPNHGDATDWLERHLRAWLELPINLVLVCHENIVGDDEPERYPLMSTRKTGLSEKIGAAVDVSAYCGVLAAEDGSPRHVAQLVPAGGRHVKDGTGCLAAGNEPVDVDLTSWVERFRAAYATTPTKGETTKETAA